MRWRGSASRARPSLAVPQACSTNAEAALRSHRPAQLVAQATLSVPIATRTVPTITKVRARLSIRNLTPHTIKSILSLSGRSLEATASSMSCSNRVRQASRTTRSNLLTWLASTADADAPLSRSPRAWRLLRGPLRAYARQLVWLATITARALNDQSGILHPRYGAALFPSSLSVDIRSASRCIP